MEGEAEAPADGVQAGGSGVLQGQTRPVLHTQESLVSATMQHFKSAISNALQVFARHPFICDCCPSSVCGDTTFANLISTYIKKDVRCPSGKYSPSVKESNNYILW